MANNYHSVNYLKHIHRNYAKEILQNLKDVIESYGPSETFDRLKTALEYNLSNSEKNIALLTIVTYEKLVKAQKIASPDFRLAHILGWCAEILNAAILIFDDVVDKGLMRRGLPCWYTLDNVGLNGITDAYLIEKAVFVILKRNFAHLDCYVALMELFNEVCFRSACGKNMDVACSKKPVNVFKMEAYNIMAVNKGTYYNFCLPFALSMNLAGFTDAEVMRQSMEILCQIGLFFQIQNDFLDCFGTMETAGKIGTDIEDSKYSWLAITCMERANEKEKKIMQDCYGSNDPQKVQQVKELYRTLDLPAVYVTYEEKSYNNIQALIKQTDNGVPHDIFLEILNKIYRRSL